MSFIKLSDGRQLAFEQFGDRNGIPVIFQHGLGDSRLARHPDEKLTIEAGIRLITVDRPGYGESSPNPGRNYLNWVQDIEHLANELNIHRFGILGHSAGAPYALAIAFKLSDRVSKVVLASPLGQLNVPGVSKMIHKNFRVLLKFYWFKPLIRFVSNSEAKRANSDIAKYTEDQLKESPNSDKILFSDHALLKMFEDGMKEAFRQGGKGWQEDIFACINWGFNPEKIKISVKIYHGSSDEILFHEMGRRLATQIPNSDFQLYDGEGHYCLYKHWAEILNNFSQ